MIYGVSVNHYKLRETKVVERCSLENFQSVPTHASVTEQDTVFTSSATGCVAFVAVSSVCIVRILGREWGRELFDPSCATGG